MCRTSWSPIAAHCAISRPATTTRALEEELLLAETADGAGVALYLDPGLLKRLENANPLGALTRNQFGGLLHGAGRRQPFVYTAWRLHRDAPVSLLGTRDASRSRQVRRDRVSDRAPSRAARTRPRCTPVCSIA